MIVYSGTKSQFHSDVMTNDIGNIILAAFKGATGNSTKRSEIDAWSNSLRFMHDVIEDPAIPADAGVAIEYHIPRSSKRIDFILTGTDAENTDTAVLVELKQWQQADLTTKDGIVATTFKGGPQETPHPSYQAWTYKCLIEDYNQTVQEEHINLYPCAYLHNYEPDGVINHPFYQQYTKEAPVFLKPDALKLQVRPGFRARHNYASRPGRKAGGDFSTKIAEAGSRKTAMRFMRDFITRNSAPRLVYEAKLAGTMRRNRIGNLFSGSGSYHNAEPNTYDCLLVDEAHRLSEKSGWLDSKGENQVKELINSSKLAVFFIDEDQKVTLKDIGEKDEIRRWAKKHTAKVTELKLESQFRCNGSDGYLAWLDNALQVGRTANELLDPRDYDFKVVDDPAQLHALIRQKNQPNNKARVVAGYCPHTCQGLELDYVGVIVGPDLIVRDGEVVTSPAARASTDKSVHGWKALYKAAPEAASKRLDLLIKNTYRTLMTRGQKGCYVYFTDKETAEYFKTLLQPASAAAPAGLAQKLKKALDILPDIAGALRWKEYLPVYSLEAACGAFGRGMAVEPQGWAKCPPGLKPDRNMFVARVSGRSMEPRLRHGDYCVFRANVAGTRQNKIVLVQHSSIADPDTGGSYTVKKYTSKKKYADDGAWQHEEIVLKPLNPAYADIVIPNAEDEESMVVAEVAGKCA